MFFFCDKDLEKCHSYSFLSSKLFQEIMAREQHMASLRESISNCFRRSMDGTANIYIHRLSLVQEEVDELQRWVGELTLLDSHFTH